MAPRVQRLDRDDSRTAYDLAVGFLMMGFVERAIDLLVEASWDPGRLPVCSAVLGGVLLDRGELEEAALWYQRGLSAPRLDDDARIELHRGLALSTMLSRSRPQPREIH